MPVLREAMKSRLIQMEEALFIASGQRFEAESEAAAEAAFLSNRGSCHIISVPAGPSYVSPLILRSDASALILTASFPSKGCNACQRNIFLICHVFCTSLS